MGREILSLPRSEILSRPPPGNSLAVRRNSLSPSRARIHPPPSQRATRPRNFTNLKSHQPWVFATLLLKTTLGFCNRVHENNLGFLQIGVDSKRKRNISTENAAFGSQYSRSFVLRFLKIGNIIPDFQEITRRKSARLWHRKAWGGALWRCRIPWVAAGLPTGLPAGGGTIGYRYQLA